PEGYLFTGLNGNRLNVSYLSRRHFKRMIKKAGVPVIRFHDLRHTHLTHLLEAGVHIKVAGDRAGHTAVQMTENYSHVTSPVQYEAAHISERMIFSSEVVRNPLEIKEKT